MIHLGMLLQENGAATKVQEDNIFTCLKTFSMWNDFVFTLHNDDKEEVAENEEE